MKIYDSIGPNPKLVRMFAAEKGFTFKETVKIDIMKGENRQMPFLAKNPAGGMPAVETDDGKVISETIAICELIEEAQPAPALIGTNPTDRAETRMWVRRVEWKIIQPMTDGFRFAEGLPLFKTRMVTVPEAGTTALIGMVIGSIVVVPRLRIREKSPVRVGVAGTLYAVGFLLIRRTTRIEV